MKLKKSSKTFTANALKTIFIVLVFLFLIFVLITYLNLTSLPYSLEVSSNPLDKIEYLDRNDEKLLITYKTKWNVANYVPLNDISDFIKQVFVFVEDKRFYKHSGVDWKARVNAMMQGVKSKRFVRGASTISEQTVKMFNKRKRTLFAKWLEGIESFILENRFSKNEILEFYLNEVPYSRNIRGIKSASLYFFNRDLNVLTKREVIALAVMLRSPSSYDPKNNIENLEIAIDRQADALYKARLISKLELKQIKEERLKLKEQKLGTNASHFISFIRKQDDVNDFIENGKIKTTLDSALQKEVKKALDTELENLKEKNVRNGGALVIDLKNNEILAWAVGGDILNKEDGMIDAITILRQPGSTLKPFLYARALEKGWTASTIVLDAPLAESVNKGIHRYRNYSDTYYGPLRLREALANSLNTPAVRTINFITDSDFLRTLKKLGFDNLQNDANYYGGGLALGNGEVTLFELARAYAVLARSGVYKNFKYALNDKKFNFNSDETKEFSKRVFDKDCADIINDILADREARRLEFGRSAVYDFTYPTSFKTGTSSDFRDAWVVAFTRDYLVAVWMGNYNRDSMKKVSGSQGPMLVMRVIFSMLDVNRGITQNHNLSRKTICAFSGLLASEKCPHIDEIYKKGTEPTKECDGVHKIKEKRYKKLMISYPVNNMTFAIDHKIPLESQAINFEVYPLEEKTTIYWWLNGKNIGTSNKRNGRFMWNLKKGKHKLQAVTFKNNKAAYSKEFKFEVK